MKDRACLYTAAYSSFTSLNDHIHRWRKGVVGKNASLRKRLNKTSGVWTADVAEIALFRGLASCPSDGW